jgi:hypothetical protein
MKKNFMAIRVVVILSALLLAACSGKAQNNTADSADFKLGGGKALASPTIITGQLESINGNEWVVDGQTFIVDSALLDPENPVQVGDSVNLEMEVNSDGAFVVTGIDDGNDNTSGETEVENDNEQGNENDNEGIEDNHNEVENEDEFDDEGQNSNSSDDDADGSSSDDD